MENGEHGIKPIRQIHVCPTLTFFYRKFRYLQCSEVRGTSVAGSTRLPFFV